MCERGNASSAVLLVQCAGVVGAQRTFVWNKDVTTPARVCNTDLALQHLRAARVPFELGGTVGDDLEEDVDRSHGERGPDLGSPRLGLPL